MKIEVNNNTVIFCYNNKKKEIHPIWLRERVNGSNQLDPKSNQRLFDPSFLENINIDKALINEKDLVITFNDGVTSTYKIDKLTSEFLETDSSHKLFKKNLWDSSLKDMPMYEFKDNFFESEEMYNLLKSFYKYGFIIIKKVPTIDNFIVKFANSIGNIRPTNFGEYFNVKSIPNPNDLAYTSLALSPHTDNPYRKPIPCIQLLHCIENEVSGGLSTLIDGFNVANYLKKTNQNYFDVLTKIKVKFKFVDTNVVLENEGPLIEIDEIGNLKQVRFSTRLDFVPILKRSELELYYNARKEISNLYNSNKFRIEFKLAPGHLLMIDNYRLLHGRTMYDANEGKRFLQGCYIDYDSSEGKLKHLMRKFNN